MNSSGKRYRSETLSSDSSSAKSSDDSDLDKKRDRGSAKRSKKRLESKKDKKEKKSKDKKKRKDKKTSSREKKSCKRKEEAAHRGQNNEFKTTEVAKAPTSDLEQSNILARQRSSTQPQKLLEDACAPAPRAAALGPMTQAQVSLAATQITKFWDPELGRMRARNGNGEIVEECVSRRQQQNLIHTAANHIPVKQYTGLDKFPSQHPWFGYK
mmetsp:Transcript_4501/g.6078  ORF Transcript_4501/g.6078 Transcript_4501/m.6078 type:complete len:212 (+) Transcript_4501:284-919(+)|eukprot:CAMPEP_0196578012 /NCGR_PEP_ID=MMETSP1081-20130531/6989_1 /TAXON_ID=36882 /ORGANISM="Pyramimonas amylifera, Strain CCMP720" /LENGTH=211 /DNA_ID=CAMNT_0041897101 /DNA_START=183 /DNA_END=818 /DNA_ORIENTATION=+